jgi:hypothetical protein
MTIKALEQAIGGLSNPSKMPGLSFGTPAEDCPTGSILRDVAGSVCEDCYAMKGCYRFPVVKDAQENRIAILMEDLSEWQANMTSLLAFKYRKKTGDDAVFRWHDSGDLQSWEHLMAIVDIAIALPNIRFWLPTKEYKLIRAWGSEFPSNLVVRVSAPMKYSTIPNLPGTVGSSVDAMTGYRCGASTREGECGPCRKCWDISVEYVDYPEH